MEKKQRVLTEMQQSFLDNLMSSNGDFKQAMKLAGYSDNISVKQVVTSLREEIIDTAKDYLAMNAPKAAAKMVGLLDDPNMSGASNLLKTAGMILDKVKIGAAEDVTLKVPSGGLFILPAKGGSKVEEDE